MPPPAPVNTDRPPPGRDVDAMARALLPTVYAWCARLGGGRIDAEEAANDTLLILMRRADRRPDSVPVEAWAYAVTRRVVANHRRRAWWVRWVAGAPADSISRGPSALARLDQDDVARRVWALLDELPGPQREALVLCDVEDRSCGEVARLTGVPEGTIRSRLRLARARFRDRARFHQLGDLGNGDEP